MQEDLMEIFRRIAAGTQMPRYLTNLLNGVVYRIWECRSVDAEGKLFQVRLRPDSFVDYVDAGNLQRFDLTASADIEFEINSRNKTYFHYTEFAEPSFVAPQVRYIDANYAPPGEVTFDAYEALLGGSPITAYDPMLDDRFTIRLAPTPSMIVNPRTGEQRFVYSYAIHGRAACFIDTASPLGATTDELFRFLSNYPVFTEVTGEPA
ncbi:hypothetical protein [Vibrio phage vB_VmeM-Yong XC32]|nr:hypothetical protein [Vibrio phage vB_VmeM-Yong XC31]QAX96580.1 hypothetical protein [Vibrio phage vB_VmeM-Yong XC32]QAX96898.1 hypothetical protein [Vibrio phage vB_VmeM-Yong MS31]QAX97203.1 hypothetical protein [Vibrio phage vB_VmeM-Yong MS32]